MNTPLLFTLNSHGGHRQVLAKASKTWPEGYPIQYANYTAAKKALAKLPDPQNWTVYGHRPYYLALIDWDKAFAETVPPFQEEIHAIAFAGGLPAIEVYKLWREYSAASFDQSALLSEFKEAYALKLKLKVEIVIEDDKANGAKYLVTPAEAAGFEQYIQKHFQIPALQLARIYFHYTRQGLDLMNLSLPPDIIKLAA